MTQFMLDCSSDKTGLTCSLRDYTAPPATVDHYAIGPVWGLWLAFGVLIVGIIAIAVVRYNAHTQRGETERERILNPPKQCPTCGYKSVA